MLQTKRGYEDPTVRQIAVFLQNRVGQLGDVLRHLERRELWVHALSVVDAVDFAVLRILVEDPEVAAGSLTEAGFSVTDSRVIVVQLPDERKGMLKVCQALLGAELNIHYAYPALTRPPGGSLVIIHVDDPDIAIEALEKRDLRIFRESDFDFDEKDDETELGEFA